MAPVIIGIRIMVTAMNKNPNYGFCYALNNYLGINRDMDPDPQH